MLLNGVKFHIVISTLLIKISSAIAIILQYGSLLDKEIISTTLSALEGLIFS